MKRLALIIAVVCISVGANAQGMFENGTQIFKLGIGVNGDGTPFEVSYERGVQENFLGVDGLILGLGGNLGYYGYKKDFFRLQHELYMEIQQHYCCRTRFGSLWIHQ